MQGGHPWKNILATHDKPEPGVEHIRLNKEVFKDLTMWKAFFVGWNGRSLFLDTTVTPPDLELHTDAAGSVGFGGYFCGKWLQGSWPPHMQLHRELGLSIEWQELFLKRSPCAQFPARYTKLFTSNFVVYAN